MTFPTQVTVPNTDLVVGDIMLLDTGDKISADGIVVEAQVRRMRDGMGEGGRYCMPLMWRPSSHAPPSCLQRHGLCLLE